VLLKSELLRSYKSKVKATNIPLFCQDLSLFQCCIGRCWTFE